MANVRCTARPLAPLPPPSVPHQVIVGRLFRRIAEFCDQLGGAVALTSPADISWGDDSLVQPDVFVAPRDQVRTREWARVRTLLLVAEVLSPSTSRHDRFQKRRLYQANGVGTLWLVDPDRRSAEVWTPRAMFPTVETHRVAWHPESVTTPLTIELGALFAPP